MHAVCRSFSSLLVASLVGCSTIPSTPEPTEVPRPLIGLAPTQHCDAAAVLDELGPAVRELQRGLTPGPWGERDWPTGEHAMVRRWLQSAHCDHTHRPRSPRAGFDALTLTEGAVGIAAGAQAAGRPGEAVDVLVRAWTASQNAAQDGSLVAALAALEAEGQVTSRLLELAPRLSVQQATALLQDTGWLQARRVRPSVVAEWDALTHTSGWSLWDSLIMIRCGSLLDDVAPQLDGALLHRDTATIEAIGAEAVSGLLRWDPGARCVAGYAAVLSDAVATLDAQDAQIRALRSALLQDLPWTRRGSALALPSTSEPPAAAD